MLKPFVTGLMRAFICVLCFAGFIDKGYAQSAVWKVSGEQHSLYIGGTLHILKPSDFPLPKQFDEAYSVTETLVLEADLSDFGSGDAQNELTSMMMWQDGSKLSDHLNAATLERLTKKLKTYGLPANVLMDFKPGLASMTMGMIELGSHGLSEEGVDTFYDKKARKDNRKIVGLETTKQQLGFVANMGMKNPDAFINYSIDDLNEIGPVIDKLSKAWRQGDMQALSVLMIDKMQSLYPDIYSSLLVERNKAWLPKLIEMLGDAETELVLVGVGHLAGEDSVLALLKGAGYKIEQLP